MISQAQGLVRAHGPIPTSKPGACSACPPCPVPRVPRKELGAALLEGASSSWETSTHPPPLLPPRSPRLSLSYLRWCNKLISLSSWRQVINSAEGATALKLERRREGKRGLSKAQEISVEYGNIDTCKSAPPDVNNTLAYCAKIQVVTLPPGPARKYIPRDGMSRVSVSTQHIASRYTSTFFPDPQGDCSKLANDQGAVSGLGVPSGCPGLENQAL